MKLNFLKNSGNDQKTPVGTQFPVMNVCAVCKNRHVNSFESLLVNHHPQMIGIFNFGQHDGISRKNKKSQTYYQTHVYNLNSLTNHNYTRSILFFHNQFNVQQTLDQSSVCLNVQGLVFRRSLLLLLFYERNLHYAHSFISFFVNLSLFFRKLLSSEIDKCCHWRYVSNI